jgi:hypothetical protein
MCLVGAYEKLLQQPINNSGFMNQRQDFKKMGFEVR